MKAENKFSIWAERAKSRPVIIGAALLAVIVLITVLLRPAKADIGAGLYTAQRGDFLISVVEGGTIQAVNEVSIRSEMEGSARVIYIVPEGTYVKKGDLLVELDSAAAQDEVNQQLIAVEKAQFALIAAEKTLSIQKSIAESDIRAAELKLEFAKKDLDKFKQGQRLQDLREARNSIASFEEKLAMDKERLEWSEKLFEQGYETKSNLDRDQYTYLQTQLSWQMATNALWLLETFDHPKTERQFESAVEEAEAELARVRDQALSKIAQYEADFRTQDITYKLSQDRLARYQRQLEASKIHAPQDGLVVYSVSDNRFSNESLIEEGATVRNRQVLIKLPDVSSMKLSVKIHESHINMIRSGQPAFVVLDSMPDQRFRGVVSRVGLLPDTTSRWGNPNLKVYATEIVLQDNLPDVKPGVSARAEIIVTNLQNVVTVPIQAVATRQGRPVVYVSEGGTPKPVPVTVGMYNTKFIEIASGLDPGARVLLAPPFDTQQKDLGGSIVAGGDEAATNLVALAGTPPLDPIAGMPAEPRGGGAGRRGGEEGGRGQVDVLPGDSTFPVRPDGAAAGGERTRGEGGPRGGANAAAMAQMVAEFDKDGDGELNEEERTAMRTAMRERFPQFGGGRPRGEGELGAGGGGFGGGEGGEPRRRNRGEGGEGGGEGRQFRNAD